ncbi:MAG: helix-turn-helix domain-containing protein [Cyanobacteria bacterium J06554_1]
MTSYSTVQKQQLSQLGAYLQEKRQEQGKSLEDISLQTYIRAQLLKAVETGDTTDLPQPIFVQGFIRRYADALGLDGTNFSKQFPVHSIPDTPRPVPRPATQVDMSYQKTPLKPVVQAKSQPKPKPKPPLKPAIGAMPLVNEPVLTAGADSVSLSKKTSAAATRDLTLDPRPIPDSELTTLGLNNLSDAAPAASLGQLATEELPVETPSSVKPSPMAMGGSLAGQSSGVNWLPWGIGAAAIVGAIALLSPIFFGGGSGQQTAETEAPPPPAEVAPIPQAEAPAPEPEPEPDVPASDAPVSLNVEITEAGPSWMSITVDGAVVFEGLMEPGTEQSWEGQESITMNVGNAGAALVSANGSDPTPAGNPGGAEFLTFEAAE